MVRVSSLLQSWSKAVVCVSTPRMYPRSGYFLGVLTYTTAWDRLWGGEQTFWFEILSALPCLVAVWFAFWNSDHVVLKSSIRTSASPRRQWSHRGLRVTQHAYFSLLTHTKQLLLVTFCDPTAGIWVIFRTHGRTADGGRTEGQTDVEVEIVI